MNSNRREIPVTSPERELQWYCYSPSLFLASTANRPRPLSSFDIHARWRPVSQSILSRRYHVKIGDCEQSIDVSEPLLKRDTFTLILESDHLHQPTYNLNIILWSSLTGGSTMYVCLFPAILKKNKKKASESGLGLSSCLFRREHTPGYTLWRGQRACMHEQRRDSSQLLANNFSLANKLSSLPSPLESVS